jgi:hypothetical protein
MEPGQRVRAVYTYHYHQPQSLALFHHSTMSHRGKAMSDDLRVAIVNMAHHLSVENIITYTHCKRRTVQRVLSDFRKRQTALRPRLEREFRGAKRSLTLADVTVSLTSLCVTCWDLIFDTSFYEGLFDIALRSTWTSCRPS